MLPGNVRLSLQTVTQWSKVTWPHQTHVVPFALLSSKVQGHGPPGHWAGDICHVSHWSHRIFGFALHINCIIYHYLFFKVMLSNQNNYVYYILYTPIFQISERFIINRVGWSDCYHLFVHNTMSQLPQLFAEVPLPLSRERSRKSCHQLWRSSGYRPLA